MVEQSNDFPTVNEPAATGPCNVCSEELDPVHQAYCSSCLQFFHLRMMENVVAKDCGIVWFDEDGCSMVFSCNNCYAQYVTGVSPATP